MSQLKFIFIILVVFVGNAHLMGDWYWRDYDGTIPADALVAGTDVNGPVYIGQGFTVGGLAAGRAIPGELKVAVKQYGNGNVTSLGRPKVLCSDNMNNFRWVAIYNASTFHGQTRDLTLVSGGYNINYGDAHIGRYKLGTETKIGYTDTYSTVPYVYYDNGYSSSNFEVLVYGSIKKNEVISVAKKMELFDGSRKGEEVSN